MEPQRQGAPLASSTLGRATTVPFAAVMVGPKRTTTVNTKATLTCAVPLPSQVTILPDLALQAGDRRSRPCLALPCPASRSGPKSVPRRGGPKRRRRPRPGRIGPPCLRASLGPRLVHMPSEPGGSQWSPAVSSGASVAQVAGLFLGEQATGQNPDKDEVCSPVYDRSTLPYWAAGRGPGGPGSAGRRRQRCWPAAPPCRTPRLASQGRLLPICCPRRAIRGRSTAERAADLGWS
jgi:hypothetical protein